MLDLLEPGFGERILQEVRIMRQKAETMRGALIDPNTATITVVTIPEKAAVEESRRLIETVEAHGVSVSTIVINHVMPDCDCRFCREKKSSQRSYIGELSHSYKSKDLVILPDYGGEVKGEGLMQVARDLYGRK
jgi:arsenite-transporting ATPase